MKNELNPAAVATQYNINWQLHNFFLIPLYNKIYLYVKFIISFSKSIDLKVKV